MLIKRPHITEKTLMLAEKENKYTFEVAMIANRVNGSKELENMFGVKVEDVTSFVRLGKFKRFGKKRDENKRSDIKLMVFKLKKGDKIDLFAAK
jgi:large subunit ribosomal protein L23